jgi:hypothetical protein
VWFLMKFNAYTIYRFINNAVWEVLKILNFIQDLCIVAGYIL